MRSLVLAITALGLLAGTSSYGTAGIIDRPTVVDIDPSLRVTDLETKGDLARAHQNYGRAADYYRSALRLDPKSGKLYNKLGISLLKDGELGSARSAFSKAAKLNPKDAIPLNNLGAVACMEKRYKPATKYLKQALALDESDASVHANLAEAWLGQGMIDRAMTEYSRAMELDGDIFSNGQTGGMKAQLHTPEQMALISYMIAKAYAKRGNMDGALDYLQRAKDSRYPQLASVYVDPEFAGLWKDPRLGKIVPR